ncbi:MAG TPA: hypothetical protein VEQ65_13790, partial [Opitutus sp.]|nr:hypothetical protein [Opitutus sp.]
MRRLLLALLATGLLPLAALRAETKPGSDAPVPARSESQEAVATASGSGPSAATSSSAGVGARGVIAGAIVLAGAVLAVHAFARRRMQHWNIGRRIGFGFGAVLTLIAGLGVVSYEASVATLAGFDEYRTDAQHSVLVGRIQANFLEMHIAVKEFQATRDPLYLERYAVRRAKVSTFLKQGKRELANEPARLQTLTDVEGQIEQHTALFALLSANATPADRLAQVGREMTQIGEAIDHRVEDLELSLIADQDQTGPAIDAKLHHAQSLLVWLSFAAMLLSAALAFIITRSITGPLRVVASSVSDGADRTAAAAAQVSAESQTLADGSTEQAASLEETSAS